MSDIFIAEILVLLLIFPVIIRPFSRTLQWMQGLAILPIVALLCQILIIAAFNLRFSYLPVVLLVVLVLLANLSRLFRFLRSLPTDWFGFSALLIHGFLLLLFALTAVSLFLFKPEGNYVPAIPVVKTIFREPYANGIQASYTVWEAEITEVNPAANPVVLYLPDTAGEAFGRITAVNMLAEAGYTVVQGTYSGFRDYKSAAYAFPQTRSFAELTGMAISGKTNAVDDGSVRLIKQRELSRLRDFARKKFGETVPLFLLAEGRAAAAALESLDYQADLFSGSLLLFDGAVPAHTVESLSFPWNGDFMPGEAGTHAVFCLTGDGGALIACGELVAEDALAAFFLGQNRDVERKDAQRIARRILTWFNLRRQYEGN